jgi:REP element-mobilizing transposase RayT
MIARRKNLRLPGYDYSQPGVYFVTICTAKREHRFGTIDAGQMFLNDAGTVVKQTWIDLRRRFPHVILDDFVVMPNHLHGIVVLRSLTPKRKPGAASGAPTRMATLSAIVRAFKSESAVRVNSIRVKSIPLVWQRNYFEHIVRFSKGLDAIRRYIRENPARWDSDPENARA